MKGRDVNQELSPPKPPTELGRGLLLYGGGAVTTAYGHPLRIQESSNASGPHVWLFTGPSPLTREPDPLLSLAQAIEVRDRLTQFIDAVPKRWRNGRELLAQAYDEVYRERRR